MSAYPVQPHYDGLEVVHYDAPETLSSHGLADSAYNHELGQKFSALPESPDKHLKDSGEGGGLEVNPNTAVAASRPWYKRRTILFIVAAAILILAIGLGVGLGVGLSTRDDSPDQSSDGGSDDSGICQGGFCGKILSLNRHEGGLYVFGRSSDKKTIKYIKYDEESEDWGQWESLGDMGSAEELVSPPASQHWYVNGTTARLDVFVVERRDGSVWNAWHSEREDWDNWRTIGSGVGSPLATCALRLTGGNARLDIWGIDEDDGTTIKTHWRQWDSFSEEDFDGTTEDVGRYDREDGGWYRNEPLVSSTLPAISCRDDNDEEQKFHDVMWYSDDGNLFHSDFPNDDDWADPQEVQGKWIGEPSLLAANDSNTDVYFFGVQDDHEMYYMKPNDLAPKSLGGKITSVPSLRSLDQGGQVDIVALNSNGTIVHQHHDGVDWLSEWEDLGIQASSAPALRAAGETLFMFALNSEGELMVWSLENEAGSDWKGSIENEENLGGKLSLEYWTGD